MFSSSSLPDWARDKYEPLQHGNSEPDSSEASTPNREDQAPMSPQQPPTWPLRCFQAVEFLGAISSVCLVVIHGAFIFLNPTLKGVLLRIFGILFGGSVIFVEMDFLNTSTELRMFDTWFFRGWYYVFVAMLAIRLGEGDRELAPESSSPRLALIAETAAALTMFALGLVYVFMGTCCLRSVKELLLLEHRLHENLALKNQPQAGRSYSHETFANT